MHGVELRQYSLFPLKDNACTILVIFIIAVKDISLVHQFSERQWLFSGRFTFGTQILMFDLTYMAWSGTKAVFITFMRISIVLLRQYSLFL